MNKNVTKQSIYYAAHVVLGVLAETGAVFLLNGVMRILASYGMGMGASNDYGEVVDTLTQPNGGMILYVIIVAPLIEELVFRQGIIGLGRKICKFYIVNIASAVLFGLYHGNLIQGICAFLLGLMLGAVFQYGSGYISSLIVHMSINAYGLYQSELLAQMPTAFGDVAVGGASIALTALVIYGIIRLGKTLKATSA